MTPNSVGLLTNSGCPDPSLVAGQCYFERNYANDPNRRFYQFGDFENVSICGSSTSPCGSVAGTRAYMCAKELLPHLKG